MSILLSYPNFGIESATALAQILNTPGVYDKQDEKAFVPLVATHKGARLAYTPEDVVPAVLDQNFISNILIQTLPSLISANRSWYNELDIMKKVVMPLSSSDPFPWKLEGGSVGLGSPSPLISVDYTITIAAIAYSRSLIANRSSRSLLSDITVPLIIMDGARADSSHFKMADLAAVYPGQNTLVGNFIDARVSRVSGDDYYLPMFGLFRISVIEWMALRKVLNHLPLVVFNSLLKILPYTPWWYQAACYQIVINVRRTTLGLSDSVESFKRQVSQKDGSLFTLREHYFWHIFSHRYFGFDRKFNYESNLHTRFANSVDQIEDIFCKSGLTFGSQLFSWLTFGPYPAPDEARSYPLFLDSGHYKRTLLAMNPLHVLSNMVGDAVSLSEDNRMVPIKDGFFRRMFLSSQEAELRSPFVAVGHRPEVISWLIRDTIEMSSSFSGVARVASKLAFSYEDHPSHVTSDVPDKRSQPSFSGTGALFVIGLY